MRWNRALLFFSFFSILSGILLHKYSQKSSKVQNTIINYSKTSLTRTLKGNENLFELSGSIKIFNFLS